MENCLVWSEGDVLWNDNNFYWNLCEVIVEVPSSTRTIFVDPKKKRHSHRWELKKDEKKEEEEKRYIKIICLINDEMFEEEKYVGKKINVQSFDEELVITEIKKINVSAKEITNILNNNIQKNTIENIKILHTVNIDNVNQKTTIKHNQQ